MSQNQLVQSHGIQGTAAGQPVLAYTDESGNTGNHVFDTSQPWFWTATLVSETELDDEQGRTFVAELNQRLGTGELHGSDLGIAGIEAIAADLKTFFIERGPQFVLTRVEKQHVAALKFADTILDSGNNQAVSPFHYWTRFFRLSLALVLILNLSPRSIREFWDAYARLDGNTFRKVLQRVAWNVERRVADRRVRELLLDALRWGVDNPERLLLTKATEMDAPNMVAFALVINLMHQLIGDIGMRVVRFVADEQNQFARSMRRMYEILKGFTTPLDPFSWTEMREMATFQAEVEILRSHNSVGLQIADVALWLTKRSVEDSMPEGSAAASLVDVLRERGLISEFSLRQLALDVAGASKILMARELTPDQEARGRSLLAEIEADRGKRMAQ